MVRQGRKKGEGRRKRGERWEREEKGGGGEEERTFFHDRETAGWMASADFDTTMGEGTAFGESFGASVLERPRVMKSGCEGKCRGKSKEEGRGGGVKRERGRHKCCTVDSSALGWLPTQQTAILGILTGL